MFRGGRGATAPARAIWSPIVDGGGVQNCGAAAQREVNLSREKCVLVRGSDVEMSLEKKSEKKYFDGLPGPGAYVVT